VRIILIDKTLNFNDFLTARCAMKIIMNSTTLPAQATRSFFYF